MTIRLGSGEYDFIDKEYSESASIARSMFLEVLFRRKSKVMFYPISLYDFENLPEQLKQSNNIETRRNEFKFLMMLADKEFRDKTDKELKDRPIFHFLDYMQSEETDSKYREILEKLEQAISLVVRDELILKALENMFSNWSEIRKVEESNLFCSQIENWAKDNNLYETWMLNFILDYFRRIYCVFDNNLLNFIKETKEENEKNPNPILYNFNFKLEKAISDAISKLKHPTHHLTFGIEEHLGFPEFEYKCRNFKLPAQYWISHIKTESKFKEEASNFLQAYFEYLKEIRKTYNFSNDSEFEVVIDYIRTDIEKYCDYVDEVKNSLSSKILYPYHFPKSKIKEAFLHHQMPFNRTFYWHQTKQIKSEFIEEAISEIKGCLIEIKKQHKDISSIAKKDFNYQLNEYVKKVKQEQSKNLRKTPIKKSGYLHFEWLVDFQVPPTKSYARIAKDSKVVLKSVREGIKSVAELIGIKLRVAKHSGRPKGAKTQKTYSHRVTK